jgi:hypothetical protein
MISFSNHSYHLQYHSARVESPRIELLHDHITAVKELVAFTAGFGEQVCLLTGCFSGDYL